MMFSNQLSVTKPFFRSDSVGLKPNYERTQDGAKAQLPTQDGAKAQLRTNKKRGLKPSLQTFLNLD